MYYICTVPFKTTDMNQERLDKLKTAVEDYAMKNIDLPEVANLTTPEFDDMVNIGVSMMMTKYKIGWPGGSFVQGFVDNDLRTVIATADSQNIKLLRFYQRLLDNCPVPMTV